MELRPGYIAFSTGYIELKTRYIEFTTRNIRFPTRYIEFTTRYIELITLYISPGALGLYPDKIHNKLIFPEKVPRGTYINILKVPKNPPGAFQEFKMESKMAAAVLSYLGNCVKQSILAQFSFVINHFNWFYGQ